MAEWTVTCEPVEGNTTGTDKKNEGGLIVKLVRLTIDPGGETKREEVEHSRVAFARKNSKQPKKKFDEALKAEIETARHAAEETNKLERQVAEAEARARRAQEALDKAVAAAREANDKVDEAEVARDEELDQHRSTEPAGVLQ